MEQGLSPYHLDSREQFGGFLPSRRRRPAKTEWECNGGIVFVRAFVIFFEQTYAERSSRKGEGRNPILIGAGTVSEDQFSATV